MELRDLSDRYVVEDEIGRGSIGIVYRAEDLAFARKVALKVLRPDLRNPPRQRARFVREARLGGLLGHPNIVPVYDVGALSGEPCIVMALLSGRSLRSIMRAGRSPRARVLGWFTQACNGIAYAHRENIAHRDIKPAHIFIGDYGQVVITDWGLAKTLRSHDESEAAAEQMRRDDVTRIGDIIGTPAYMAPEQAEGRLQIMDHRVDIYALGAILYEILTGTRPYESSRSIDVLRAVRRGPPELPSKRAPDREVAPALEAACMRAMARDPEERFGSALDLAANIDAWFESSRAGGVRARDTRSENGRLYAPSISTEAPGASVRQPAASALVSEAESTRADPEETDAARRLAGGLAEAAAFERQLEQSKVYASEAGRLLAALPYAASKAEYAEAFRLETRSRDTLDRAAFHFIQANENLEHGASDPRESRGAREALTRLHRAAWRFAAEKGNAISAEYHRLRAEIFDDGALVRELENRAALSVNTEPLEVEVQHCAVDDRSAVWVPGTPVRLGHTPLTSRTVTATRALIWLTAPDGLQARLPVYLQPGESRFIDVSMPPHGEVPRGFVFVPGGSYLMGHDDDAPGAVTPREVDVGSFCLARTPVPWEDYFEFLEDFLRVGVDPTPHLPRQKGKAAVRIEGPRIAWNDEVVAPYGAPVRLISQSDARAYAEWLGHRLGARLRLPTDEEWEYAAGAADLRRYPWGDRYVPGFADNRRRRARGPAPLGAFPEDESPFGIRNVAGGVREWTSTPADEPGRYLLRGGSWRSRPEQCRICARATAAEDLTHEAIGFRLAADATQGEALG